VIKGSGLLEIDPAINPNAEYTLGLQVENYLDESIFTDSMGNVIVGPQRNDFNVNYAIIKYVDEGGNLTAVPPVTVFISGTVRPGGEQNASAIVIGGAIANSVVQSWLEDFNGKALISEVVDVDVQIFGKLNSGETAQTGVFRYPVLVCFDCDGISPKAPLGASNACPLLPTHTTAIPVGHGPCCAPQDFEETCVACGGAGEPCCAPMTPGGMLTCDSPLTCSGMMSTTATELCPYPNQDFLICAKPTA
jgi:hypothetical protein